MATLYHAQRFIEVSSGNQPIGWSDESENSIFRLSKQISNEALDVLYEETIFDCMSMEVVNMTYLRSSRRQQKADAAHVSCCAT
jgi:hypothetical protein